MIPDHIGGSRSSMGFGEIYSCRDPEDQVYTPSDDSYLLAEALLNSWEDLYRSRVILDLGTGSGYIAHQACLELMRRGSHRELLAIDISPCSIEYVRRKLPRECLDNINVIQCDGASCLRRGSVDLVAINPPYLPVREHDNWLGLSWSGGDRGVEVAIEMVRSASEALSELGSIYVVLSSLGDLGFFESSMRSSGLVLEIIARRRLFFEELVVYRLTRA